MTNKFLLWTAVTFVCVLSSEPALTQEPADESDQFTQLAPHLSLLNELSERRRPNSFFPNEQSQTYGVQVDYVNVGRGNLTFLRRDLVTVGRIPIVAARVYDSAAGDSGSFGPGWRFALAETIEEIPDGSLHYSDESGSDEMLLAAGNRRFVAERATLSDVLRARKLDNRIVLSLRAGWTKEFENIDDTYRLVKVTDRNGNSLILKYGNGRLTTVEGANNRWVEAQYNDAGQIAKISDDQGREILYEYSDGSLSTTIDLGRNRWEYEYHVGGQLKSINDPLNQAALVADYHRDGRVATAKIRHRRNTYVYNGATTTVTNGRNLDTVFTQGNAGITTKIVNAAGTKTEITLGENLLPTMLNLNDVLRTSFAYDLRGQLISMTSYEPDKTVDQSYTFDWDSGQIQSMSSSEGIFFEFEYDNDGRLRRKRSDTGTTRYKYNIFGDLVEVRVDGSVARHYQYNDDGQLIGITGADANTKFKYDEVGRLTRVEMPDSEPFQYEFNDLGLRTLAVAGGSTTEFKFDAASRLISFSTERGGEVVTGYDYVLDADNLARKARAHNSQTIAIDYDGVGNPISYGTKDRRHSYSYDDVGRFVEVTPMHGDSVGQSYAADEADWRGRADTRTGINLVPEQTASAIYGTNGEIFLGRSRGVGLLPVTYEPTSATLQALNNFGFVAPDSAQRAALSRSRIDSLDQDPDERAVSFNRPSNAFFLPPEMNQANCFQMCTVWEVVVNIANTSPQVGESVRFRSIGAADDKCIMHNDWTWGDGTIGFSSGHFSTIYKTYNSAGTKSGNVVSACTCLGLSARANWAVSVQSPSLNQCEARIYHDTEATLQLPGFPRRPYEYGMTFVCAELPGAGFFIATQYVRHSFSLGQGRDPCAVGLQPTTNSRAFGHTHPFFNTAAEYHAGVGCFRDKSPVSSAELSDLNNDNRDFSSRDKTRARSGLRKPLYLGTPLRDAVKVYRQDPTVWRVSQVWP